MIFNLYFKMYEVNLINNVIFSTNWKQTNFKKIKKKHKKS